MFSSSPRRTTLVLLSVVAVLSSGSAVAKVEAVKGKRYPLHQVHGPWMVMVATLQDVPQERRTKDGLSAWDAADRIVYELRRNGIPAYTYLQDQQVGQLDSASRQAKAGSGRIYIARHQSIAVLAHSFPSPDDKTGKAVLDFVKNHFEPAFLKDQHSGGILPSTPGRKGAFSRALIVPNPLRSPEDIRRSTADPLVKQLNSGSDYSLLKNEGKYTLVVATFSGNTVLQVGHQTSGKAMNWFDDKFGDALDKSASDAWQLCQALRSASRIGYDRDYEAWLFHDRHKSVVTIGSFESKDDPRIRHLAQAFSPKIGHNAETGQQVRAAEIFSIPKNPTNGGPERFWVMDVQPKLMEVPKTR